ncbi:MAG: DegQ family serine endoprotease [Inquilinus sp.]|nr:DegQ family serine endoprotease [Inquilinus sp.]
MRKFLLLALALLIALPAPVATAQQPAVPDSREQITLSFAPLVRQTAPAVVNIYTSRVVRQRTVSPLFDDPFFRRFFGDDLPFGRSQERTQNALGSGVIVDPGGLIVTNHHVIAEADQITVVLSDRREFDATVVQSDEGTDLALLRIDANGTALPHLTLADSDELEVGDLVLAIGNPFGVGQTVTSGIVSALARTTSGITDYNFFIQTDAAINPGNSGGALVAMDGRLVGINSAIYSRSGGSLGIGFAIPANMVRAVIASVDAGGRVTRPWLGAEGQLVTQDIAQSLGLEVPGGVVVSRVDDDGPAARAGLRVGDVILSVNGRPVDTTDALRFRVATRPIGERATLGINRAGRSMELAFDVEPPPEMPPRDVTRLGGRHPLTGATVANLSPALIEEIGYDGSLRRGVIVLGVARNSAAARLRLQPGDVVVRINGTAIADVAALRRLLNRGAEQWSIAIRRGDRTLETTIRG